MTLIFTVPEYLRPLLGPSLGKDPESHASVVILADIGSNYVAVKALVGAFNKEKACLDILQDSRHCEFP